MSEEHHKEQIRSWTFPIELINLYKGEVINAEELMLLGKINVLCDPKDGCYASNNYLARDWRKTPHHVSTTISKFEKLGLIEVILHGNKRTIWPLFQDPRCGKMHMTVWKNAHDGVEKCTPHHSIQRNKQRNTLSREGSGGTACPLREPASSSTVFFEDGKEVDEFTRKASHYLEEFVRESRKISKRFNRATWYREMAILLKELKGDKKRLRRILEAFVISDHDPYRPQAYSAQSFRVNFLRIETWVNRNNPPEPEELIRVIEGRRFVIP